MPPRKRTAAASSSRRSQSPSASVASEDPSEASHTSRASRTSTRKPRTPRATAASARQRASGSASAVSAAAAAAADKPKTPRSTRTTRARSRTPAKRSPSVEREASTTPTPTTPSSRKPRSTKQHKADAEAPSERDPPLPTERNPVLPAGPVPVKLQVIQREVVSPHGTSHMQEIVIGRVKLPTVNGPTHGFLLKRFDTNALAASSMFKLAFPYATPAAEQAEMNRLLHSYNCHAANGGHIEEDDPVHGKRHVLPPGSSGVMLQGVWIPAQDAQDLAEEYHLATYTLALIEARAAVIDGKPYFLDDDGRPFANASGTKLDSKDRAFLWTNLETEREARKLKDRGLTNEEPAYEEAPEEPEVQQPEVQEAAEPTTKRSRPQQDREDKNDEHQLAADPEEALRAAREEAKAIQAASASTSRSSKAKAKRRVEPEPEEKTEVLSKAKRAQPRKPLTRSQQRAQDEIDAIASKKTTTKASTAGTETAVAVAQPPRRIAGSARVRAVMGQHPYASAAGVAGVSAAAVAAATAAAAATGLMPPDQWAAAVQAVQAGVATLQSWFA